MNTLLWWKTLKARDSTENLDGRILLKCILKKWTRRLHIGLIWHSSEPSASKKSGELLD
jgi:hypothetical protein